MDPMLFLLVLFSAEEEQTKQVALKGTGRWVVWVAEFCCTEHRRWFDRAGRIRYHYHSSQAHCLADAGYGQYGVIRGLILREGLWSSWTMRPGHNCYLCNPYCYTTGPKASGHDVATFHKNLTTLGCKHSICTLQNILCNTGVWSPDYSEAVQALFWKVVSHDNLTGTVFVGGAVLFLPQMTELNYFPAHPVNIFMSTALYKGGNPLTVITSPDGIITMSTSPQSLLYMPISTYL